MVGVLQVSDRADAFVGDGPKKQKLGCILGLVCVDGVCYSHTHIFTVLCSAEGRHTVQRYKIRNLDRGKRTSGKYRNMFLLVLLAERHDGPVDEVCRIRWKIQRVCRSLLHDGWREGVRIGMRRSYNSC